MAFIWSQLMTASNPQGENREFVTVSYRLTIFVELIAD